MLPRIGLRLNEAKTSVRDALSEDFDFLGFTLGRQPSQRTGNMCFPSRPSRGSIHALSRTTLHQYLRHCANEPWCDVALGLNRKIRGWAAYSNAAPSGAAFRALNRVAEASPHTSSGAATRCRRAAPGDSAVVRSTPPSDRLTRIARQGSPFVSLVRLQWESRMREIRKSGSMSRGGKRDRIGHRAHP